jgi:hypothetical protein
MWFDHVWNRANGILFLKGRVSFCRPDGSIAAEPPAPSVLLSYDRSTSRRNYRALQRCKLAGQFLTIR